VNMPTRVVVLASYAVALVMDTARIPVSGETVLASSFRQTWGGKGSDMAVQAARLGADVEAIGVLGSDTYGDDFVRLMRREGVGIQGVRRSLDRPTGAGFIIKDHEGNNLISVDTGANALLVREDIDRNRKVIESADVVLAQLEIPIETALYGLAVARNGGAKTILNPAPGCDLRERDISVVDVLTPNSTEARICLGHRPDVAIQDHEVCASLRALGCSSVIMTRGDAGALIFDTAGFFEIPAMSVEVVDTNGAGDSFSAGVAVALGEGMDLVSAAEFAGVAASLSCTGWETVDSYHDRRAVDTAMKTVWAR